jgi:dTMP kinase
MVLNIALEGVDGVGKTTQLQHLKEFFEKKHYKVTIVTQPNDPELIKYMKNNLLLKHELALMMALDRSRTWTMMKPFIDTDTFDIILWDRSILSSYAYNTNDRVTDDFITEINRFFPEMDLYIVIDSTQFLDSLDYQLDFATDKEAIIRKYRKLAIENKNVISIPYIPNKENQVFESIVQTIFENLPRCNWCGKIFKKTNENRKYCSDKCRDYAREDQNRKHALKHYHRYKNDKPGKLGSYGANLHGHRNENPKKEQDLIKKEKKRLGL